MKTAAFFSCAGRKMPCGGYCAHTALSREGLRKNESKKKHSTARYREQCCASMYLSFCHTAEKIVEALEFVCQCLEQCGQLGVV